MNSAYWLRLRQQATWALRQVRRGLLAILQDVVLDHKGMPNDGEANLLGLHRRSNGLPAGKGIYLDLIYNSSLIQVKRNVRRAVLDHKSMPEDGEADLHGLN